MNYSIEYIDNLGKKHQITYFAESELEIIAHVKSMGGYYVSSKPFKASSKSKGKFNTKSASMFCYQLSTMLSAGIGLLESLNLLQSKASKQVERDVYRQLYESVQKGNSLSDAMIQNKGTFDRLLISMVQMGEQGGDLDGALKTMSDHYTKNKKIKDKIKAASIYPAVLFVVSLIVVLVLVVFVLPGITSSFGSDDLPFFTKILMNVSSFIIEYWWILLGTLVITIMGAKIIYETPRIKVKVHRQMLYIPIIGKLMRTIISARLARSFASLYSHGISTLDMIELTSVTLDNAYFEKRLKSMKAEVSYGISLSQSLGEISEFDPLLSSMLRVGEETGSLGDVLSRIAEYFEVEAESAITQMIGIIEPTMIVTMGITIGFIVISIIQPIFKMYETIG